jgi:UDP-N-acetylglucosamine/UDP-N-acetylgalactosamine diphosphorylase
MDRRTAVDWRAVLARHGQREVWEHLAGLDAPRRSALEGDLGRVDFVLLESLVAAACAPAVASAPPDLRPPRTLKPGADAAADARATSLGRDLLAAGKVACLLVAGGQGSRLGHPGPKGTFPATPVRGKPLFQVFAEKLQARSREAGRPISFAIMTSEENDAETRAFFAAHRFFGLAEGTVRFFTQGMLPAVDESGKLVLRSPEALFLSPDGHGGTLRALRKSGVLEDLAQAGVEELFYFQVDNPLVNVCDPLFLGHHRLQKSEFSSKVVSKEGPDEKVGVLAESGGRMTLIEYSDLPPKLREATGSDGALVFSAGNIAIHALSLPFVRRITEGPLQLPFHVARKKLEVLAADGSRREVRGIKFETFIFDALAQAANPMVMEVRREDEFAPIKNASGQDSPETSRDLQSKLAARMLETAGVRVPRSAGGAPAVPIEIGPLFAADPEELRTRLRAPPSFDKPLYLGEP